MSRKDFSVDRRNVLKTLGAGAAAASASGVASASETETVRDWEYQELEGQEKWQLMQELYHTDEFDELYDIVLDRGDRFAGIYEHSRAGRLTTNDVTREIVSLRLSTDVADEAALVIGRDVGDGVAVASVEYNTRADDGVLRRSERYDLMSEGSVSRADEITVEPTEYGVHKKIIEPEQRIRQTKRAVRADLDSDSVTTSEVTLMNHTACNECKWAVPLICQNVCGAVGGFACGFFGIISGGIGGVACLTIVEVTCGLASLYGCTGSRLDEVACNRVGLC